MKYSLMGILVFLMITLAYGCGAKAGPHGAQDAAFSPYPVEFRDIIQGHIAASFDRGQVMRNSVVRPPSAAWVAHQGERLAGYVGEVDFSLKDEARQTFRRVTYCYFLYQDAVLLFEPSTEAAWCETMNKQGE